MKNLSGSLCSLCSSSLFFGGMSPEDLAFCHSIAERHILTWWEIPRRVPSVLPGNLFWWLVGLMHLLDHSYVQVPMWHLVSFLSPKHTVLKVLFCGTAPVGAFLNPRRIWSIAFQACDVILHWRVIWEGSSPKAVKSLPVCFISSVDTRRKWPVVKPPGSNIQNILASLGVINWVNNQTKPTWLLFYLGIFLKKSK